MSNKDYNIHERIFQFILAVLRFIDKLPKTSRNLIIIGQLSRSVTSMGANDQEADGALTRNDFVHGCTVVRKEGKETVYWIRLLGELNKPFYDESSVLQQEGSEIVVIISTIYEKRLTKSQRA